MRTSYCSAKGKAMQVQPSLVPAVATRWLNFSCSQGTVQHNTSAKVSCLTTSTTCSGPLDQHIQPLASDTVHLSQRFVDLWVMSVICSAGSFLTGSDLCHSSSHTLCAFPVQYWALLQVPIQQLHELACGHPCLQAKAM